MAFWLVCYSVSRTRQRKGWFSLVVCLAVPIIKRPDWSPWLLMLALGIVATLVFQLFESRTQKGSLPIARWVPVVGLWCLWLAALWESQTAIRCSRSLVMDPSRPIVCLGNSLTTGLSGEEAYPVYLQQMTSLKVINTGQSGISVHHALGQLPDVLIANPQVVVIELGGHDYLKGFGKNSTRDDLVQILNACREIGAEPILFEIPRGFIVDSFSGLERGLAREYDLEVIEDGTIRKLVLRSPALPCSALFGPPLSDDGLHPNAAGAQHLAQAVFRSLERLYGAESIARE